MAVEVETPEEYTGFVMGDIPAAAASFRARSSAATQFAISAKVPLGMMFGLRHRPAYWYAGPCDVHHAVRYLRARSQERG